MIKLLLFGFGYTGERFCRRQQAGGWDVQAVVRSDESRKAVAAAGATPIEITNAQQAVAEAEAALVWRCSAPRCRRVCVG
jgi:3-hydroxyisobutyrate dehydrogenase-like beta-hydroxyacid dehydrogenase